MSLPTDNIVKYQDIKDEHITDIKKGIELFVKNEEYWDKFANHCTVERGHREFQSRRLIKPLVKKEDIKPRAELIAPRATKMVVATFTKTVDNYGDKAEYTREDLQFHFDDTLSNLRYTLQEVALQKKNLIKGAAFVSSRAIISYDTSICKTLDNARSTFTKNGVKRWDGRHFLVHMTDEERTQLMTEIAARNEKSEPLRTKLEGVDFDFDVWKDWLISVPVNDTQTLYKDDTHHYMVMMGKRAIDNKSPVDVSKLSGEPEYELINKGLGTGIIEDVDGHTTSDDNKQKGAIAINIDGLGACVSDDLAILNCEVPVNTIPGTALPINQLSGYVSHSGNEHEVTLTGTQYTELEVSGARYDATAGKYYASGNTIVAVQVKAAANKTLGSVTAAAWSASYKLVSGGADINAEVLGCTKTAANYDTLIVRVPNDCYSFAVECTATAS